MSFALPADATAACLVAINPMNKSVGDELQSTFARAVEAFLHQRNFSVEVTYVHIL